MRFEGRVRKDRRSRFWLVEVPLLDVMSQGTSKGEALLMIADAIEALVDRKGFKADVRPSGGAVFTVGANQKGALIALMLKRQRVAHGLTLMDVARRLKSRSPNAYARYEQGKSVPTVEKLDQLMKAIAPDFEAILKVT